MGDTAELLFELFSEEIPARLQARAAEDLKRLATAGLSAAGLAYAGVETFVTPRRLTLVVQGLARGQADTTEERKGPRAGAPAASVAGFLKAAGLARIEDAPVRETPKGAFHFALIRRSGRPAAEVLPGILERVVAEFPWPKSMRWADGRLAWVRPLRQVLALFDGRVLALAVALSGEGREGAGTVLPAGDQTRGHRFLAPTAFAVKDFADYRARLRQAYVMLDAAERRDSILRDAHRAAAAEGLALVEDAGLLAEVSGLVEWPVVLIGRIDAAFMDVPREVLTTAMRAHQKYFSLQTSDGALAPRFLLVANLLAADGGRQIVAGNERVLRARLSDAKFFWDQDRQVRLDARVPALADMVFHAKLGSLAAKVARIEPLAAWLAAHIPGADPALCRRAAHLAKADLTTGMVGEFPELQGVMGRYYARHDGEAPAVAEAIAQHYSPLGPSDACPREAVAVAVALADKLDTLAGFFAMGEKPTGSKDPFGLRRAALGVIRLILENGLRLPLAAAIAQALILHGEQGHGAAAGAGPAELLDFFADRLKVHLREQGLRHDLVTAVFGQGGEGGEDDLVRLLARLAALKGFLESEDGANLLTAYRRAANILRIEERKDGIRYDGTPDPARLVQDEEKLLLQRLDEVAALADQALGLEEFAVAALALARLRTTVDGFFDQVTVNVADAALRANRLHLLARIRGALDRVADFSKIEG